MPIRIYEIAKKLGVENRAVLAKAKELGISAQVASSSLDKVTAEYLEQHVAATMPKPDDSGTKSNQDAGHANKILILSADQAIVGDPNKTVRIDSTERKGDEAKESSSCVQLTRNSVIHLGRFGETGFQQLGTFVFNVPTRSSDASEDLDEVFLLTNVESATFEFKSSARWDMRENRKNPKLEFVISKTVAAFLNTEGGTLVIGVADSGQVIGLKSDYLTLQKQNRDGYEVFLHQLIGNTLGHDLGPCFQIHFHKFGKFEVCCVICRKAPRAVYLKDGSGEHFFIRSGTSSIALVTSAAVNYCMAKWGPKGSPPVWL